MVRGVATESFRAVSAFGNWPRLGYAETGVTAVQILVWMDQSLYPAPWEEERWRYLDRGRRQFRGAAYLRQSHGNWLCGPVC